MTNIALPSIVDSGLSAYIEQIKQFPMLSKNEEQTLANKWADEGDTASAHTLVTSHLRLVVKMAMGFRGYGLPVSDIIAEGNIGLMQAVKNFDPSKGFRLSTYAMWWIKASINEYVLRSWSLVKMGTSAGQKKLFFNLRRIRNKITGGALRALSDSEIQQISDDYNIPTRDIIEMDQRLGASDASLNAPISDDGDGQMIDYLEDESQGHDVTIANRQDYNLKQTIMQKAMGKLNNREKDIIYQRRLSEPPTTLDIISKKYDISKERVRQIENRSFEKLQQHVMELSSPSL